MPPEDGAQCRGGDLGIAREEGISRDDAGFSAEIAAWKRRLGSPWCLEAREIRLEALHDVLGEVPVGRDLAAEYREHRRGAGIVVDAQGVIASHSGRIIRAVVV